ncbi:MAG: DUF3035 domain-containing protein [Shimia sp.]
MRLLLAIAAVLTLGACAGGPGLRGGEARGDGPDEFGVIPQRELALPASFATLPPPTPGGANRADLNPQGDAIAVLGGVPGAGTGGDPALLAQTGRFGVDPAIRGELRAADARFRANRGRVQLFRRASAYWRAYAGQTLDPVAETSRLGAAGVAVPSAPPR